MKRFPFTQVLELCVLVHLLAKSKAKLRQPHVQLEQHHVDLDLERNRYTAFRSVKINTNILATWEDLPEVLAKVRRDDCTASLQLDLTYFDFIKATICLFKDELEADLFLPDAEINILGENFDPKDLYIESQPVTGFIKHNPHAKVSGYIIHGNFYGTVRFFDSFRLHHVVFNIEPVQMEATYNPKADSDTDEAPEKNAIVFEYIARTNEEDPPKAGDYEDGVNAPDPNRPRKDHSAPSPKPPSSNKAVDAKDTSASPVAPVVNPTVAPVASPATAPATTPPAVPATTGPSGSVTGQTKRRKKRQTHDQETFSHENSINADNDIIHSFKFKAGMTKHNMFDTRRLDAYVCELCIWIQPNFAKTFGLSGGVLVGAAEVIDLIKFLNWIFRSLDFDQDGLPENIGFAVKSLQMNDQIRVTVTDEPEPYPRKPSLGTANDLMDDLKAKYSFSTNFQTISTKSALALATKHMQDVFKDCCASIAFVFHSMAPAISTTNLRGLCTSKNVAVVSGLLHMNKLAKFDVFRGLIHAMGHLFGGHHDDVTNLRCHENALYRFLNPFPMHPVQQLNVGMRLNSFRMSSCSKDHITQFLSSNAIHCLVQVNQTYCGNGIEEDDEECDCGSLWQCHARDECCGEGDTMFGCRIVDPFIHHCNGPRTW